MATTAPAPAPTRSSRASRSSGGVFASTITLGRVAGVEIGINWTWLGIVALVVWSLAGVQFPAAAPGRPWPVYAAMGVVATAAFFGSLILHELGHALQARRDGIQIEGITLWLFGGVAKFSGRFPSAGAEFRVAVAGPAVSLALGVALVAGAAAWPQPGAVRSVLAWLGYINLALLVFNLVPALPLDGGRVLRAALWSRTHDFAAATHKATRVSGFIATVMIMMGILETVAGGFQGLWLALIGWFVLEAGRAEEHDVTVHGALENATVETLMTREPITVEARESLAQVADRLRGTARHTAYPVIIDRTVVGLLPLRALANLHPSQWAVHTVDECMIPAASIPRFSTRTPAVEAFDQLAASLAGRGVVIEDGELVGVLSLTDIARTLAVGRPV
jgi:Zn-dependent protease/predicted transcriptional regulator